MLRWTGKSVLGSRFANSQSRRRRCLLGRTFAAHAPRGVGGMCSGEPFLPSIDHAVAIESIRLSIEPCPAAGRIAGATVGNDRTRRLKFITPTSTVPAMMRGLPVQIGAKGR